MFFCHHTEHIYVPALHENPGSRTQRGLGKKIKLPAMSGKPFFHFRFGRFVRLRQLFFFLHDVIYVNTGVELVGEMEKNLQVLFPVFRTVICGKRDVFGHSEFHIFRNSEQRNLDFPIRLAVLLPISASLSPLAPMVPITTISIFSTSQTSTTALTK